MLAKIEVSASYSGWRNVSYVPYSYGVGPRPSNCTSVAATADGTR